MSMKKREGIVPIGPLRLHAITSNLISAGKLGVSLLLLDGMLVFAGLQ